MANNNTENVTTKFRVDISDLKQGIAEANKIIKTANAEFKNATAGMDNWADSADGLTAKIEQQNKIVDAEKTKLDLLKQQLDRLNKSQQDGEQIIADLTDKYNVAVEAFGANSTEAKKYAKQLDDAKAAQERNAAAADDLNLKILNQDTAVKKAQAQANKYENALDELRRAEDNAADGAGDMADATDDAADSAEDAAKKQKELDEATEKVGDGFTTAKGAIAGFIANGLTKLTSAIGGAITTFAGLAESTREYREDIGKLETAFDSANVSVDVAKDTYKEFYSVLGEEDRSVEAVNHLAKFVDTEQDMAKWTDICTGVWGTFGDSLPIEGLTEASNETMKTGKLTGVLADALNWAGVNEDDFQASLDKCTNEQERQALITDTLNGLYSDAADAYRENNAEIINARKANSEYNDQVAELGRTIEPITTKIRDGFGRIVTKVVELVKKADFAKIEKAVDKGFTYLIDKVIPAIEKGFGWIIKNKTKLEAAFAAIVAGFAAFKGVVLIQKAVTAFKLLAAAIQAVGIKQAALNAIMAMNPIGLIVAAIAALVAAFVVLWNKSDKFREFWLNLWDTIKEKASAAWESIKEVFTTVWEFLQPYIEKAKELLSAAFEEIKEMFTAAWEAIKAIWDFVQPYFSMIWENVKAIFSVVAEVISGYFSVAWEYVKLVWDVAVQYFTLIWENIKVIFSAVKDTLGGAFKAAWDIIKAVWDIAVGYFKMIWNNIKLIFSVVKSVLSGDFKGAWDAIRQIWDNVKGYFETVWGSIKTIFSAVTTFFKTAFSNAWEAIKGVFKNVGTFFGGIWDTIKEKFTTIGTKIGDAIGGAFKNAINAVLATVENALNFVPNAINDALDLINELPGVDIPSMPNISLPRLAKGGVVNRPTFAEIGENGAEAIIPLENNKAGLKKIASLLANEINSGATAKGNTTGGNVYNFNQTNNSPKALSRFEIYRQTKNLINAVKGV